MASKMVLTIGILLLVGCAGTRQSVDNSELQLWVGNWQGIALRENRNEPPRQWTLILSIKAGRLRGVMSDDLGEMRQKKVEDLKIADGELRFSVSYETVRGLQVNCRHRAQLQDDKLLSVFDGSEGGRAFEGKWEAQRISDADRQR